jgi:phenylacetic acid degradation operon negative regulatory protein
MHEVLNLLLWTAEVMTRPTLRNLSESYESWAHRHGLRRRMARLEERRLVERDLGVGGDRLFRLTAEGRVCALGGRDPEERWARPWDGRWRLAVFDVATRHASRRARLRRHLRSRGFGCLQGSVWVTPDASEVERLISEGGTVDVKSLIFLDARPCAGETDGEMVAGAWDFDRINRRYRLHLEVLGRRPASRARSRAGAKAMLDWMAREAAAWLEAVRRDPLLPEKLLPPGYLGKQAWRRRSDLVRNGGGVASVMRAH